MKVVEKSENKLIQSKTKGVTMYKKLKHAIEGIPTRVYVGFTVLFLMPFSAYADSNVDTNSGIFGWLKSITSGIGSVKTFAWVLVGVVGVVTFCYGLGNLAYINIKPNYQGKTSNGHCIKIMIIGAIVASGSIFYGMIADTVGASEAVSNATSDDFSGFN